MSHPVRFGRALLAATVVLALVAGVTAAAPPAHSNAGKAITQRMVEKEVWIPSGDHMVTSVSGRNG